MDIRKKFLISMRETGKSIAPVKLVKVIEPKRIECSFDVETVSNETFPIKFINYELKNSLPRISVGHEKRTLFFSMLSEKSKIKIISKLLE